MIPREVLYLSTYVTCINLYVTFFVLRMKMRFFYQLQWRKSQFKMSTPKKFKTWSRKWHNLNFTCWNCWSYSNERHTFSKSLGCDVLALTELHNKQNNPNFTSDLWVPSAQDATKEDDSYKDSTAGVTILLSKRMRRHIDKAGHVGTRIAWVRLRGPICPIFFIAVYIPHNIVQWHRKRATPLMN